MAKDANLNKMKEDFLAKLKKLLENKDKKEAKQLQTEAEQLFGEFKQEVSQYVKAKSLELEKAHQSKEQDKLSDLDKQLNQI